jgi:RNA polymerase sigma factor (sigma-70 family)
MLPERYPAGGDGGELAKALARLTRRERQALYLRVSCSCSVEQVALIMDCSRSTASAYLKRARAKISA